MFVFLVEIAEVFAVVSTWSVLLSAVLGWGILCGPSEWWAQACSSRRGVRLQAAAGSCTHARVLRVEQAVAQMLLSENRHVFWCFQNKRNRSCSP